MGFLSGLSSPILMGILLGGLYALIAMGLSLVFGVMKLINVAHGDLVIFGSYFAYAFMTILGVDPILSLIVGMPFLFAIGFGIQKFLMSRAFKISMEAPLIIAFGLSIILQNVFQIFWSPLSRGLTTDYALKFFALGPLRIPLVHLLNFILALVVMFILREFMRRTYLGRAINAASQDRRASLLMGINIERIYAFAFAIAMAIAALAGVCLGLTFPFTPVSGMPFLIVALGGVVLGGLGSIKGTFIGGMVIGLAQTLGGHFLGTTAQMLVAYIIVLIILTMRPQGLFGR
ncbi:MAG: branched-chain amino acid ABC transporter permease [Deltaproteobacteria bacterium]|nr:branched-chain amino acid ABC transporter permease [Deltaproteobacteria bacterium]